MRKKEKSRRNLMKIVRMLPFLDSEEIDELLELLLNNELKDESLSISSILPFLHREQIKKVLDKSLEGTIAIKPVYILPFLQDEELDELVDKINGEETDVLKMDELLPFLNKKQIQKLFQDSINNVKKEV